MVINYNRDLRKFICNLEKTVEQQLKKLGVKNIDEFAIYFSIYFCISRASIKDKKINVLYKTLLMTGYSDLYTKLFIDDSDGKIDNERKPIFAILKNVKNPNELSKIVSQNPTIAVDMVYSIVEFGHDDIYSKVLKFKKIPNHIKEKVSKINTLYYQDLENYDIDINLEYMLDKFNKNKKYFSKDYLINSASAYIYNLRSVNYNEFKDLMLKLIKNDIGLTQKLLDEYSIDDMDTGNKDYTLIHNRVRRLKKYSDLDIDSIIDDIHFCNICDLFESYIDSSNGFDYEALCQKLTLRKKS